MTYHTGPWAHPPRRKNRAASDMRKAIYVALALLCVAIFVANKTLPQTAYDAVNHEVIR